MKAHQATYPVRPKSKRGPKPDHVKIDEDWGEAVKKALKKKRPKGGWPKPEGDPKPPKDDQGRED